MPGKNAARLLLMFLCVACVCSGDSITYYVNQKIAAGTVDGDIVTDGTVGILTAANFLDWNLVLSDGTSTFDVFGPPTSQMVVQVDGTAVSATPTELLFNFSAPEFEILDFLALDGPNLPSVCFSSAPNCESYNGTGEGIGESVMIYSDPQFQAFSGTQVVATAAPEPSTWALVIAIVAFSRFRRR